MAAKATVDLVVKTKLDWRPVLPIVLVHMTGPRKLNAWYLGVWRWCWRVR